MILISYKKWILAAIITYHRFPTVDGLIEHRGESADTALPRSVVVGSELPSYRHVPHVVLAGVAILGALQCADERALPQTSMHIQNLTNPVRLG